MSDYPVYEFALSHMTFGDLRRFAEAIANPNVVESIVQRVEVAGKFTNVDLDNMRLDAMVEFLGQFGVQFQEHFQPRIDDAAKRYAELSD